jgi:transposase
MRGCSVTRGLPDFGKSFTLLDCVFSYQSADYSIVVAHLTSVRHRRSRLAWCLARRGWNLRTWCKIHWSDESRFLLHVTDDRMRVWRHKNTAYTPRNIQPTVPYGGGSVMVWGCISHDCKLDLVTIQGNLTGDQYIRDVLQPVVVPHFDNHPLATRPVYMDDNARPHRSRAVTAYLQSEAVTSVPWPAMSPDLNPIEHIWDMLGHRIQAREPLVQNIRQRVHRCRSTNSERLMTLLDLSPADFRRFLTVLVDNRHAYNRDVLQSYWTSDGLPLYCSQPTGELFNNPAIITHKRYDSKQFTKVYQDLIKCKSLYFIFLVFAVLRPRVCLVRFFLLVRKRTCSGVITETSLTNV